MTVFVGYFDSEDTILEATAAARRAGFVIRDVYTPYAVHGMDEAMGLAPSRLPWVCLAAGIVGVSFGFGLQYFVSVVSWPLNVGGKPFHSFPAFIPVAFELTVLTAALVTVAALFARARLRPKLATHTFRRVTDDLFALVLDSGGRGRVDEESAFEFLLGHHAVEVAREEAVS